MKARARYERRVSGPPKTDAGEDRRRWRRFPSYNWTGEHDPFYKRVRQFVGPKTVVLDVGAGSGRLALPLASVAESVIAVDPSKYLLGVLEREARRQGIANITPVLASWEDAKDVQADISICSFVLHFIYDAASFLEKMDRCTRRRVFLNMGALNPLTPLRSHFLRGSAAPGPTYLDAILVLKELGAEPQLEMRSAPTMRRFKNLSEAVRRMREDLDLPDTPEVRAELRELLPSWLVERDGILAPPYDTVPRAIISWTPITKGNTA